MHHLTLNLPVKSKATLVRSNLHDGLNMSRTRTTVDILKRC